MKLFVTHGFQETSMTKLSKESGIAIGTIYHHFSGKSALIEETYLYSSMRFGEEVHIDPDTYKLPYKEQFRAVWLKACNFFISNPIYFYFKDSLNYSPLISEELRAQSKTYYKSAFDILLKGIELGKITFDDPELLGNWVYNTIVTAVQMKLGDETKVNSQTIDQLFEMCWAGVSLNKSN